LIGLKDIWAVQMGQRSTSMQLNMYWECRKNPARYRWRKSTQ